MTRRGEEDEQERGCCTKRRTILDRKAQDFTTIRAKGPSSLATSLVPFALSTLAMLRQSKSSARTRCECDTAAVALLRKRVIATRADPGSGPCSVLPHASFAATPFFTAKLIRCLTTWPKRGRQDQLRATQDSAVWPSTEKQGRCKSKSIPAAITLSDSAAERAMNPRELGFRVQAATGNPARYL